MVRSGLTSSSTPTSPNWSEQSTSATRWERARATAQLTAITDFPTPPLAPTTVKSLPSLEGVAAAHGRGRRGCRLAQLEGMDAADGRYQLVAAEGLLEELARPGQHGPAEGLVLDVQGEQDHARPGQVLHQHLGRLDAVHAGKPRVHHGHVRAGAQRLLERGVAVLGHGAHHQVAVLAQPPGHVLDDPCRLVGDQHADHGRAMLSRARPRSAGGWPEGGDARPPWPPGRPRCRRPDPPAPGTAC